MPHDIHPYKCLPDSQNHGAKCFEWPNRAVMTMTHDNSHEGVTCHRQSGSWEFRILGRWGCLILWLLLWECKQVQLWLQSWLANSYWIKLKDEDN